MNRTINLLFGVHAHQPVGNFPEVVDEAHRRCYRPFLQVLYDYPQFHFAVHFSGWLLDYLFQHFPEDMGLLRAMVARGQVEVFGGGDTEPILAVIPQHDRVGQLLTLSNKLERQLSQRPHGAWLTERVWESTVVPALADTGIRYVTVDDYHFLCAGKTAAELNGYYTTEEDGRALALFPISEQLRYRFPFAVARDAVAYLESIADESGQAAAVYFDDIEKFGIWPETHEWVFEKGWLKQFVEGVQSSTVVRTQHYGDYYTSAKTRGIVYLPTTSYIEMNEWTLPAAAAHAYADLVGAEKERGNYERDKAFLRGGIWKNFLSRYPESNWMHKRMLQLSQRLQQLPVDLATPRMRQLLYQAQANDAYWHGLFGGIYLPHLRRAIYNAIVELEAQLDRSQPRPERVRKDLDADGHDEVCLHNASVQAIVTLDGSASVREFDGYRLHHNFADTLSRQAEHYRRKLQLGESQQAAHGGIASAHDRVSFKSAIAHADLATDTHAKTLFRDTLFPSHVGYEEFEPRYALAADGGHGLLFSAQTYGGSLYKELRVERNLLRVTYSFDQTMPGFLQIELNIAMPSCDGPAGRYWHRGECPGGFGQPLHLEHASDLTLEDDVLGGRLELRASRPIVIAARPFFTVSQSEAGFEKIMQAVTLLLHFHFPHAADALDVELEVVGKS